MTTQPGQRRYDIAETVLRANIAEGLLPEGLVLLEGHIADMLQMSRAPVQHALQSLEAKGLVHRFQGRGYLVGAAGRGIEPLRTDIRQIGLAINQHADTALQSRASWERIYDTVERDVAGCVVFGRYRIIESELASHFNVSRTVVRDVLARLSERGLVRKNQSSHWIAGPLTAQTVKDHFGLRAMLEPQALTSAAAQIDRAALEALLARLQRLERDHPEDSLSDMDDLQACFIDTCILATPNERLRELIRNNLLPVTATTSLLAHLGLPADLTTITELRLVVELLSRGATTAAAAMHETHLDAALNRTIAQMKIVAIIPDPGATAAYLTRVQE
ncbi:GntR family transcriptional regulator [Allorhizobium taibaishanense]|uniref:GntR family transcriptional regulator n=1 Tax=Allorhizobium taibaishanense TaxID=887144 RepID=A0A1Q9A5Z9_9HYPH|nr:GntR family transcriptional regulator [Allorhizobium taibaishanense]MBB4008892.1 DNA-binding GntR family transcriptional regulator [Allorhizobium taibaishanense]OLP50002.1 GntR family transcriptional regulator [Allorhizobium taibaishanense]